MFIYSTAYKEEIINLSKKNIKAKYNFDINNDISWVNAFLVNRIIDTKGINLILSGDKIADDYKGILPVLQVSIIHCLKLNSYQDHMILEDDILYDVENNVVSEVKEVNNSDIKILPVSTIKRIPIGNKNKYVKISNEFKGRINSVKGKPASVQRFFIHIQEIYNKHKNILEFVKSDTLKKLPLKFTYKTVVICSKKDIVDVVPDTIPYHYINKNGVINPSCSIDPLLVIVNDFYTFKRQIVEKNILIDSVIFIGENKYEDHTAGISRYYREGKFNNCILIGETDFENGDKFPFYKWNWTNTELNYFEGKQKTNLRIEKIDHDEFSNIQKEYVNIIHSLENKYEERINLKAAFSYLKKLYPITAINNSKRIKERANEIFSLFEEKVENLFQDEYYNIDEDYSKDFALLKSTYKKAIDVIVQNNKKSLFFQNQDNIDFIVVPKVIKSQVEKEIKSNLDNGLKQVVKNTLEDISADFHDEERIIKGKYEGLRETMVITVSEYFKKLDDNKTYVFLSIFGNGLYTDVLLNKILRTTKNTSILCYSEEEKVIQKNINGFQSMEKKEWNSDYRQRLTDIIYPTDINIDESNIEEWINFLIQKDENNTIRSIDKYYEITFDDGTKIKERENRSIFIESDDKNAIEVKNIKTGDLIRVYQNPDKELLHDIIKMYDEKDLFKKADEYSKRWKTALKRKYEVGNVSGNTMKQLFNDCKSNGYSMEEKRLEEYMKPSNKTKFPMKRRDLIAIIKTIDDPNLSSNIGEIDRIKTEYNGKLRKGGIEFSNEINTYILSGEKGRMLEWLDDKEIIEIIENGAPLKKVKAIKMIDGEIKIENIDTEI